MAPGRVRRVAAGLVSAAVLCLALGFGVAAGAGTLDLLGSFGRFGSEPGQLRNPRGVAVDGSSASTRADVYVADQLNQRIERFGPTGQFLGAFGSEGSGAAQMHAPFGVAVDPRDGGVYVEDLLNHRIDKFGAGGGFLFAFGGDVNAAKVAQAQGGGTVTQAEEDLCSAGESCQEGALATEGQAGEGTFHRWAIGAVVAVDDLGTVYVGDEGAVQEFDSAGAYLREVALPGLGRLSALAVDFSGHLYAKGQLDSGVREYDSTGALLRTFDEGSSSVSGVAVSPSGDAVYVLDGGRVLRYDASGALLAASQAGQVETSIGIAATSSGTVYVSNFHGPGEAPAEVLLFGSPPTEVSTPPSIDSESAARVGTTTAALAAGIDPQFLPTTYYVEYGLDSSYAAGPVPVPPGSSLGLANLADDPAAVALVGLQPGTTYHYRFVAISSAGTTYGPDRTFTTYLASAEIPDRRAYELVSPAQKDSADVATPGAAGGLANLSVQPLQASPDGEAITYGSFTAFGAAQSAPAVSQYLSRRGAEGWSTRDISPPDEDGYLRDPLRGFSPDLSTAIVVQREPLLAAGAVEGYENMYLRDDSSGALRALTTSTPRVPSNGPYCLAYAGAAADFQRVFFMATGALIAGAPEGEGSSLYEWSAEAGLRLVSVLPDGTSAQSANAFGAGGFSCTMGLDVVAHAISQDGSRIVWTHQPPSGAPQLLLRERGVRTVQLDAPQGGPDAGGFGVYRGASTDGSKVIFSDGQTLTPDSSTQVGGLYEYDLPSERLLDLTPAPSAEAVRVLGVAGMSEDASYVYFVAEGALTPQATPRADNLYVWHAGGIHLVAVLSPADRLDWSGAPDEQSARVAPDGHALAFLSTESLTSYDNADQASGARDSEAYVYDAASEALTCVSCNPSGARPIGSATLPGWSTPYEQPRELSESGGRLFFQSADALSLRDTNGRQDVYEWERVGEGDCTSASAAFSRSSSGCLYPISTGTSSDDSYLLDASANGRDVFFSTRQGLLAQDQDERFDVYDARVGGGFAPPPVPGLQCESEACRPPSPSVVPLGAPASATFFGPGNRHVHRHSHHRKRLHRHRQPHRRSKPRRHHKPHAKRVARAHASSIGGQPGVAQFSVATSSPAGEAVTQAGAHPDHLTVSFAFDTVAGPEGFPEPAGGAVKDIRVQLPVGLIGDPSAVPACSAQQFDAQLGDLAHPFNACPDSSAVGTIDVLAEGHIHYVVPVYELVPPRGMPAQLGFQILGAPIYIDIGVRSGDYGIDAYLANVNETQRIVAATLTLWGVPADPSHDSQRGACLDGGSLGPCLAGAPPRPFLTLPTSCGSAIAQLSFDTWRKPDSWLPPASATLGPVANCAALDFRPTVSVQPDGRAASSPTGLALKLHVPQSDDPRGLAEAQLRDTIVQLPDGLTVNPAVGGGLSACSETQVGFERVDSSTQAARFSGTPGKCPDASRIGSVKVLTPRLATPLTGSVYVAEQGDAGPAHGANPFGSLLALYVVAEGSGVVVKLAGEVRADPASGRLTVTFSGAPQLPYEDLELDLYGGQRAPLVMPAACGSYTSTAVLTPWSAPESGPPATRSEAFPVTSNCTPGFAPSFEGGTTSNQAGGFSSLQIALARPDGDQPLGAVAVRLPKGVEAMLSRVVLCPQAQASTGSCPGSSSIGHARVEVGAGAYPLALQGRVYLTGPYEGAPFGVLVAVPAVAGPFDLGEVIARARVEVDSRSAQITVASDPLPRVLDGIPLDLRAIDLEIDRRGFMLDPTSCEPLALRATIQSSTRAIVRSQSRFQAAGCASLPFHPSISAVVRSGPRRGDGAYLRVTLRSSLGQANLGSVRTLLPRGLAARASTLKGACPQATFEADPAGCPVTSVVGRSTVSTPLLSARLTGPVYLVSHAGAAFPDLVSVLQGDGVRVDLVGRASVGVNGLTSAKFAPLPDVPVRRFDIVLPPGPHSLLAAGRALCRRGHRRALTMSLVAQDRTSLERRVPLSGIRCTS